MCRERDVKGAGMANATKMQLNCGGKSTPGHIVPIDATYLLILSTCYCSVGLCTGQNEIVLRVAGSSNGYDSRFVIQANMARNAL